MCRSVAGAAPSRGIVVAYDEAAQREALEERCPRCVRALTIIKVVYDGEEGGARGEGGS